MSIATLTSKGQMTLPKEIRDDLNLKPGDKIELVKIRGHYELRPRNRSALALAGILHRPGVKALTIEEMDEAVGQAVAERNRRARDRS